MSWEVLGLWIGGYLLGSVPFGLIIAKVWAGVDPRTVGSGNIGATNVARAAGKAAGVVTLLLDAAKGALPAALGLWWIGVWAGAGAGLAAFLGHLFPLFLGFKGGKGVATALGVLAVIAPWAGLGAVACWVVGTGLSRHVSVGSLLALGSAPVWVLLKGYDVSVLVMALVMAAGVFWRHKDNIARLREGREHKL